MSLSKRMHFLLNVSEMISFTVVSVINHYHIDGLYLFWDTLYIEKEDIEQQNNLLGDTITLCLCVSGLIIEKVWEKSKLNRQNDF